MRTLFVPLGVAFCCVALCQEKPDAAEFVRKVRSTYARANRFHFVTTQTTTIIGSDGQVEKLLVEGSVFAGELPAKGRFEGNTSPGHPCLVVVDGKRYVAYAKNSNSFIEGKAGPPGVEIGDLDDMKEEQTSAYLMLFARGVVDGVKVAFGNEQARIVRDEHLSLDGGVIDCWVVEIKGTPDLVNTWWVDKRRFTVRRTDVLTVTSFNKTTKSSVFNVATIDEPLPADLFNFRPPAGAKRVSKFSDFGSK